MVTWLIGFAIAGAVGLLFMILDFWPGTPSKGKGQADSSGDASSGAETGFFGGLVDSGGNACDSDGGGDCGGGDGGGGD